MTCRLLIAGAAPDTAVALRLGLTPARYTVDRAVGTDEAILGIAAARPDLILAYDGADPADGLIRTLRARDEARSIPVVALIAPQASVARRTELLEAGADEVLRRPVPEPLLSATIRALRRRADQAREMNRRRATAEEFGFADGGAAPYAPPPRVVLISGDEDARRALSGALGAPVAAMAEADAIRRADEWRAADVYLIDATGEDGEPGLSTLSELRAQAAARTAAFLVRASTPEVAATALCFGATGVVPAEASAAETAIRIRRVAEAARDRARMDKALETHLELSITDELTGIRNRRYAERHADRLIDAAADAARPVAVLMADVDHFKQVNDRHGHAAGDRVLVEVARRLSDALRGGDLLARVGGEEFMLILQGAGPAQAELAAERLRDAVGGAPVVLPDGTALTVTISVGIAASGPAGPARGDRARMTAAADEACYAAKRAGRNRVHAAHEGRAA